MRGLKHKDSLHLLEYNQSHLLQMRGLKLLFVPLNQPHNRVASFTDAWIETQPNRLPHCLLWSHLLQMRGLKHEILEAYDENGQSHLLQMRGLKLP